MTGGWPKKIGFFLWYSFFRPKDFSRWLKFQVTKSKVIDFCLQLLSWPAIDSLMRNIKPGIRVLEWGAVQLCFF